MPIRNRNHPIASERRNGDEATNLKPAITPPRSSPVRCSENRPRTDAISAAEATKVMALTVNAAPGPTVAYRKPPMTGPTSPPNIRPDATRPFAHVRSDSGVRFGIAALAAG